MDDLPTPSKKRKYILLLLAIIAIGLVTAAILLAPSRSAGTKVVGKVDGQAVYIEEAEQQIQRLPAVRGKNFAELEQEQQQMVLREAAIHRLLLKEAQAAGSVNDPEAQEKIRRFSERIAIQTYLNNLALSSVTEEQLKTRYDELVQELKGQEEVRARHILVKTKKEADAVVKDLQYMSFEDLAKAKSIDTPSANNGGDLGYFVKGKMVKEFEEAAFALKKGKISKPVKSPFGWHIIKLEDRRPASPAPFENAKKRMEANFSSKFIRNYIQKLLPEAKVEVL